MISNHHRIIRLVEQGRIPAEKMEQAMSVGDVYPNASAWREFISHLMLWLGSLALTFAVLFFVAYNWTDLGKLFRFALVELLIIAAVIGYWKLGPQRMAGKAALLGAAIGVGVLLALYGQTYQTGADPWQLFFNWGLLILPWVMIGRFAPLWLIWLVLLNLSTMLYFRTFPGAFGMVLMHWDINMYWILFLFNTLALAVWEWAATRWVFMAQRWAIRIVALASGFSITWLVLLSIIDGIGIMNDRSGFLAGVVWLLWLAALMWVYQNRIRDLFMLTGGCLSAIVVVTTFLGRHMLSGDLAAGLLFLAVVVVGGASGSLIWLKRLHREWQT